MTKFIPIFEPYLKGNEKKYLMDCIDTTWISSQGKYIIEFEKLLATYHDLDYGIATSSCTSALHLALKAIGVGAGDEVICPDLTFIAPANMIVLSGAKPCLVDIDPNTLAIDPLLIEQNINKHTKAIIVVHQFGHAAPMDEIMTIAEKYKLKVIEDNAESIGGRYKGKLLGTFGDISCYSFFGNKIITTGEGGALLTNNKDLALKCKELRDHGMAKDKKYYHNDLGYNYRMTNMQAAIGLAQVEKLDNILDLRMKQMMLYYSKLNDISGIKLREFKDYCEPVHWLMTLTLDNKYDRDDFLDYMKQNSIDCRQMVNPVHQAKHFLMNYEESNFPISTQVSKQSVHLPSFTHLSSGEIEYISEIVLKYIQNNYLEDK